MKMPWKRGKVRLADGSIYPAELLIENGTEVWNVKIFGEAGIAEEIEPHTFASKLNKTAEDVYPFSYELEK